MFQYQSLSFICLQISSFFDILSLRFKAHFNVCQCSIRLNTVLDLNETNVRLRTYRERNSVAKRMSELACRQFVLIKYICPHQVGAIATRSETITCQVSTLCELKGEYHLTSGHGCVRSETGWTTFQMNDQNSSLSRPSEGTLNQGSRAWMRHAKQA